MGNRRLKFFETHEFKKQQSDWYEVLKKDGFKDHESDDYSAVALSHRAWFPLRHHIEGNQFILATIDARLSYYVLMGQCVHQEEFRNPRDELIMHLVAEGLRNKDIGLRLKENGYNCHRKTIMFIIRRYEKKWGIRDWQKNQLTSNRVTQF